jgi:hypothetical protein
MMINLSISIAVSVAEMTGAHFIGVLSDEGTYFQNTFSKIGIAKTLPHGSRDIPSTVGFPN